MPDNGNGYPGSTSGPRGGRGKGTGGGTYRKDNRREGFGGGNGGPGNGGPSNDGTAGGGGPRFGGTGGGGPRFGGRETRTPNPQTVQRRTVHYQVVMMDDEEYGNTLENRLNSLGHDGWRLIAIDEGRQYVFIQGD